MKNAIITWSFDGQHRWHEDIIQKASKKCDTLHALIWFNREKTTTFDIQTRIKHLTRSIKDLKNVIVWTYDESLLVDYMIRNNINTIYKGIRDEKDKSFEKTQEYYNKFLTSNITTEYIECNPDYFHLSSSAIKSLFTLWWNITPGIERLLPLQVKQDLEKVINNQYIIGITWVPGSGKSYIAQQLVQQATSSNIPIIHINMDKLWHRIYHQPNYWYIRDQIIDLDTSITMNKDGDIDKNSIRNAMFSNPDIKDKINQLFQQPIRTELRQEVYGKTGIILIESALFAEHNISDIVNNNIILVHTDQETQLKRLQNRGDDMTTIKNFLDGQYNTVMKQKSLEEKIQKSWYGKVIRINNSW
jgi:pantetheine-phosphate adenylyltransferase